MLGFAFGLPFSVQNFKAIGICVCVFIAVFASVRKHEEKIETVASRTSEMAGAISFKFGVQALLTGR